MTELQPPRYWPDGVLPERAFIPGRGSKPVAVERLAAYLSADRWRDSTSYLWGVDLYNHGYAWEAHEAWEGLWRAAKHDDTQATFLQGLIQCAAASVKTSMGDSKAARRLLSRGLARLASVRDRAGEQYMGMQLARYLAEHASGRERGAFPKLWLKP